MTRRFNIYIYRYCFSHCVDSQKKKKKEVLVFVHAFEIFLVEACMPSNNGCTNLHEVLDLQLRLLKIKSIFSLIKRQKHQRKLNRQTYKYVNITP